MLHAPLLATCIALLSAAPALAQWTFVTLAPAGTTNSYGTSAAGSLQGGYAQVGTQYHAGIWNGTAASWIDLHPAGPTVSQVLGMSPNAQVGYTYNGNPHAALWTGSAGTWVDLNPPLTVSSAIYATTGTLHVGRYHVGIVDHACVWSGSSNIVVDLNPNTIAASSYAFAISGTQIVGRLNLITPVTTHAALWNTAGPFVDLNPAGAASSDAFGVQGGQQVGHVAVGGQAHAALWHGSAGSWVDLNPPLVSSRAQAVHGGWQVGYTTTAGGVRHAAVWNGTAASWTDLHTFATGITTSEANGIWIAGNTLYVVGRGHSFVGYDQALLWTMPIGPGTLATNEPIGHGCGGLSLAPITRPRLGTNWDLEVADVPATTLFGVHFFGSSDPGIADLAPLGMPSCDLRASLDVVLGPWLPSGTTFGYSLPIPGAPASLIGIDIFTQAMTFAVPPPNAFGAITSTAVRGTVGDL